MSSLAPAALEIAMRGTITAPGDPDYDDRRKLYNAMIDRRPALIARCTDAADVIAAVGHARSEGMPLAIRGGGHNGAGLGSVDDGLVIDLSGMRGVIVDPASRVARVMGGSLLGDVDHATHPFGLALPSGIISTTGVGGITLGGGLGHLTRGGGLTIDRLIAADVVLADGRLVRTSATELPDLFWALRGGGGNFGVVVSFSFSLHEVARGARRPDAVAAGGRAGRHARVRHLHGDGARHRRRLLPVPRGAAGPAVPGGAARAARCAGSHGA